MTAAFRVATSSSVLSGGVDLLDHEPVLGLAASSVGAVPVLEHDTAESLLRERVAPRAQASRYIWREPHVEAGRQHAFEVPPALEQRYVEQRLAIDFEQIERREDAARSRRARHRVALGVHLELRFVLPAVDENAVEGRG